MKLFTISFVVLLISEFRWIIISDFALSRFPRPRSLQTEEKWEESRKNRMILQNQRDSLGSAEEWHHVRPSSGRREREVRPSLLHLLSRGVQRVQPIIAFIFSPNFVGLETGPCNKVRRPFVFPIPKRNKNSGFSHVESGNRDTPRFVLKNRDIPIKSGWVAGVRYM